MKKHYLFFASLTYAYSILRPFLLDAQTKEEASPAIEKALTRPDELMEEIRKYTSYHESHRDGKNSARVLEAVADFITHHQGRIQSKPLNIFRKLKLRWKINYFKWRTTGMKERSFPTLHPDVSVVRLPILRMKD